VFLPAPWICLHDPCQSAWIDCPGNLTVSCRHQEEGATPLVSSSAASCYGRDVHGLKGCGGGETRFFLPAFVRPAVGAMDLQKIPLPLDNLPIGP